MNIRKLGFVSVVALIGTMSITTAHSATTLEEQADVNGDGRVNTLDLSYLQRRVAGYTKYIGKEDRGDLNCDDDVGTLDLSLLQRYIAGFDMTQQAKDCARKLPPRLPMTGAGGTEDYVPSDCSIIEEEKGKKLYKCTKGNDYYALEVDLKLADVSFGSFQYTRTENGYSLYKRKSILSWRKEKNYPFAVLNGQFFNHKKNNETTISFPVRSFFQIVKDTSGGILPDNERKVLSITYNNEAIIDNIGTPYFSYIDRYYDYKEVIVGLQPWKRMQYYAPIGRHFISVDPNNNQRLLFFISGLKTQYGMIKSVLNWKMSLGQTIMMDGSASSQLATNKVLLSSERKLPNVITIN